MLNDYLGFDETAGYVPGTPKTDEITKVTQLIASIRLHGLTSKIERTPLLEPIGALNLPITSGNSIQEALDTTLMCPEELSEPEWVRILGEGAPPEPTLKTDFCVKLLPPDNLEGQIPSLTLGAGAPDILPVSLLRFGTAVAPDGSFVPTKDCRSIALNPTLHFKLYGPEGNTIRQLVSYKLASVISHLGPSVGNGHYVCNNQYEGGIGSFNDEVMQYIPDARLEDVETLRKTGCLAFYRKIEDQPIGPLPCSHYTLSVSRKEEEIATRHQLEEQAQRTWLKAGAVGLSSLGSYFNWD